MNKESNVEEMTVRTNLGVQNMNLNKNNEEEENKEETENVNYSELIISKFKLGSQKGEKEREKMTLTRQSN
jgi:hypothetical protein